MRSVPNYAHEIQLCAILCERIISKKSFVSRDLLLAVTKPVLLSLSDESLCPLGSSRTILQVLILFVALGYQNLVLVLVLRPSLVVL